MHTFHFDLICSFVGLVLVDMSIWAYAYPFIHSICRMRQWNACVWRKIAVSVVVVDIRLRFISVWRLIILRAKSTTEFLVLLPPPPPPPNGVKRSESMFLFFINVLFPMFGEFVRFSFVLTFRDNRRLIPSEAYFCIVFKSTIYTAKELGNICTSYNLP